MSQTHLIYCFFFFFNDTATTEIYTLSLHDALPICDDDIAQVSRNGGVPVAPQEVRGGAATPGARGAHAQRSEEHTSELQSQSNLVCRLLLEKKKTIHNPPVHGEQHTQMLHCAAIIV